MNRKLIAAVTLAGAMAALSGCGSSIETKPVAADAASPSASASAKAPTAGGAVDGLTVATTMVHAMVAKKTAHMSMTNNGTATLEGDYEVGNPVKVAMKMSQQGLNLEVVQVGGVIYVKGIPGLPKPWIKVDPKGNDAFSKGMSPMTDLAESSDPRALVSTMRGVRGKYLGTEQVGGESTRHYLFRIPISSYGKVLSPATFKALRSTVKRPIATDYWVGGDNLPRKWATSMVVSGKKTVSELTYSEWGKPVKIVAPPASQVVTPPSR